jgi:hypothetical protein
MKALILFLLTFPAWANHTHDISAVRVHENTMVVSGSNLYKAHRATLGGQVVRVMPAASELVIYCRRLDKAPCADGRWIPGNYALKLFKPGKVKPLVSYPVTITGLERQDRPVPPETITPSPVGGM